MKIKCKEYFSYPMLVCRSVKTCGTARSFLIAQSLTTHVSTQLAVGAAKHHRQNEYLTAMFGHHIGGYLNNKIRLQSQIDFTAEHRYRTRSQHKYSRWRLVCRTCANRATQSPSWHTFEATHAGYLPTTPQHSVA